MIRYAHHRSKVESRRSKTFGLYDLKLLTKATGGRV